MRRDDEPWLESATRARRPPPCHRLIVPGSFVIWIRGPMNP